MNPIPPGSPIDKGLGQAIDKLKQDPATKPIGEDLDNARKKGKFWRMPVNQDGRPAETEPDGSVPIPGGGGDAPVNTPDCGNYFYVDPSQFDPPDPSGTAGHKYGLRGLIIILKHEWRHATSTFHPWDANSVWTRKQVIFEGSATHVTLFDQDIAEITQQLEELANLIQAEQDPDKKKALEKERDQLKDLKKFAEGAKSAAEKARDANRP